MNPYVQQMLDTHAARNGGVVRRNRDNVIRFHYYQALLDTVREKRWHMFEYGTQLVVVCSTEPLVLVAA